MCRLIQCHPIMCKWHLWWNYQTVTYVTVVDTIATYHHLCHCPSSHNFITNAITMLWVMAICRNQTHIYVKGSWCVAIATAKGTQWNRNTVHEFLQPPIINLNVERIAYAPLWNMLKICLTWFSVKWHTTLNPRDMPQLHVRYCFPSSSSWLAFKNSRYALIGANS